MANDGNGNAFDFVGFVKEEEEEEEVLKFVAGVFIGRFGSCWVSEAIDGRVELKMLRLPLFGFAGAFLPTIFAPLVNTEKTGNGTIN